MCTNDGENIRKHNHLSNHFDGILTTKMPADCFNFLLLLYKLPKMPCLKTTHTYYLGVLEVRSLKWISCIEVKVLAGLPSSWTLKGRILFLTLSWFWRLHSLTQGFLPSSSKPATFGPVLFILPVLWFSLLYLDLPLLRTCVITLGPPGQSSCWDGRIFPSPDLLIKNLSSIYNINSFLCIT